MVEELAPELLPLLTALEMPANFVPITNEVTPSLPLILNLGPRFASDGRADSMNSALAHIRSTLLFAHELQRHKCWAIFPPVLVLCMQRVGKRVLTLLCWFVSHPLGPLPPGDVSQSITSSSLHQLPYTLIPKVRSMRSNQAAGSDC